MVASDIEQLRDILDFGKFAKAFWSIYPKSGQKMIPFRSNRAQVIILEVIMRQIDAGLPVRIAILKARQLGISTFCCAFMQWYAQTRRGVTVLSIADKMDLPQQWMRRGRMWLEQTPELLTPSTKATNAIELWFDKLSSRYTIASAEGKTPGVGLTLNACHFSECALWTHPDEIERQTFQGIPSEPGSIVIMESTGENIGDWWYKFWWAAKRGESDYAALFLPWFLEDEYSMDDSGFGEMGDVEERIFKLGATRKQLAWRRWKIANDFAGDAVLFANQYPSTPTEAFLSGGHNIFSSHQVAKARETVREPVWVGDILPGADPAKFSLVGSAGGALKIFDHNPRDNGRPNENYHYVLGGDCQWSEREVADYDTAFVECLETGRICAVIRGRWDMGYWASLMAATGYYYNNAVLAPERNSLAGPGVVGTLLGKTQTVWRYPNVWIRSDDIKLRGYRLEDYGFLTTAHTKPAIVALAQQLTAKGEMDWADSDTVDEMAAFIKDDKQLKMTAPVGGHDDLLMGRMITEYVAARLRLTTELYVEPKPATYRFRTIQERLAEELVIDE